MISFSYRMSSRDRTISAIKTSKTPQTADGKLTSKEGKVVIFIKKIDKDTKAGDGPDNKKHNLNVSDEKKLEDNLDSSGKSSNNDDMRSSSNSDSGADTMDGSSSDG